MIQQTLSNGMLAILILASLYGERLLASYEPRQSDSSPTGQLPLGQSIETVSEYFLGLPFIDGALGEGAGSYDSDPSSRIDGFDCTTFVETVWAISRSKPPADWKQVLQTIRYRDGKADFVNRLHFVSLDWMSYHRMRGAVEDITARLGAPLTQSVTLIDRRAWYKKLHPNELSNFERRFPLEALQRVVVDYLSFAALLDSPASIAALTAELKNNALLVNFIRPDWDTIRWIGTKIDVSHQGFIVLKGDQIVLRHASAPHKRVIETNFLEYIRFHRNHPSLKGLQFVRIKNS